MFARTKKSGKYQYVQVVYNERIQGRVRQRVIATLGRLEVLKETGQLDDQAIVSAIATTRPSPRTMDIDTRNSLATYFPMARRLAGSEGSAEYP